MKLIRYFDPERGAQLGIDRENRVYNISDRFSMMSAWLRSTVGRVDEAIRELDSVTVNTSVIDAAALEASPDPNTRHYLAPVDEQDVWAAGVTYERSREARQEEATDGGDIYARVYGALRPELFFKAHGRDVIGHLGEVGIRADASWSVPEPELGVVFNPALEVVGFTVGNDMSSRDIEGENPLYLPQAKIYTAACALGRGIWLTASREWLDTSIQLRIERGGATVFEDATPTSRIRRSIAELAEYLGRSMHFPYGVVLLTGTGIVPPGEFTLAAGDMVSITIEPIGTLTNTVKVV
jgi:2-dehydro-3-deoxy-D-arabinonate dehydratase